ncbi:MAG TPA: AIR synthase related protein, partial [Actinomycetota bacterium]
RWVYQQYDSIVGHNTFAGPGGDAAVIRIEGTQRALAVSTDGNGRFCQLDPRLGAMHAVAEAARNVASTGARPLAVTNCLNLGNPEHPEVMWQFAQVVAGMGEACRVLETPVTGGNVSFYNQTGDIQIHPTPVVGVVGILEDASQRLGIAWPADQALILLGETKPELGGSEWAFAAHEHLGGTPPALDLAREKTLLEVMASLAEAGAITSAHDVSEGGIAVALAESAIAGATGAQVTPDAEGMASHFWLFSESAGRILVTSKHPKTVLEVARHAGLPATELGRTGGNRLTVDAMIDLPLEQLRAAYEGGLPSRMG